MPDITDEGAQPPADGETVLENQIQDGQVDPPPAPGAEGEPPPPSAAPARKPWFQDRIDELTRQKNDEKREKERVTAELAAAKALLSKPDGEAPKPNGHAAETVEEFNRRVAEQAEKIADAKAFNAACDKVYAEGVKDHGDDFKASVQTLLSAGVTTDRGFLEAALDTDAPAAVLHALGQDPDEALRIAKLPARKQAIELDRLATKLTSKPAPRPISGAPAPISPISGSAKPGIDLDGDFDMAEFMAWREKSRKKG